MCDPAELTAEKARSTRQYLSKKAVFCVRVTHEFTFLGVLCVVTTPAHSLMSIRRS